ncbi:glycoside hydrolase family 16 protein [Pontibacillus yanchengensis]|uniref:Laminarinase n=1 Tax=Pontibacillus yanchengensis Y32 TaxID=1385514 RepID=A0A0A2TJI8_9BACI|nr:glycoside hydrolase family 16 protein [Pontibacillus yanchengensis]KGP74603.1 laminarinase [Pontibacillus yanchengensis Y32]
MRKRSNIGITVLIISVFTYIITQMVSDGNANMTYLSRDHTEKSIEHFNYPIIHDGWELIWRDEFDGDTVNPQKWNFEDWAAEKNNELQYYTPANVTQEDGYLKLISKKEKFKGRDYSSGAIHTKDLFSFLYGKAEMRAKLPTGQGIFPAFWMMPNKEQTWLPEIDIMEMVGHKPNEIWMVLHWLNDKGELQSKSNNYIGPDFSTDFHTYSVEWTPKQITWLIDGEIRYVEDRFIPNEPMYLYLNTAIGGNWPKAPDATTLFPQFYSVDYVRVYKYRGGGK